MASDPKRTEVPQVQLRLDEERAGMTALELVRRLRDGEPRIHANPARVSDGIVLFGPLSLKPDEPERIGARLREILGAD
jgi:L-seryl-tRNA(Ser) seleniumtransferase